MSRPQSNSNNNALDDNEDFDLNDVNETLLAMAFNQDISCISISTKAQFHIFNTSPFVKRLSCADIGGCNIVQLYYCSTLVACVPSGHKAGSSPRKMILVDVATNTKICEISFPSNILTLNMNSSTLVVSISGSLFIYDLQTMKLIKKLVAQREGLFSLATNSTIAYSTFQNEKGIVRVLKRIDSVDPPGVAGGAQAVDPPDDGQLTSLCTIEAHNHRIATLLLNNKGTMLATCSAQGTSIKVSSTLSANPSILAYPCDHTIYITINVFSIPSGQELFSFRRGFSSSSIGLGLGLSSTIIDMAFDRKDSYLAVGSSSGTVHIFSLVSAPSANIISSSNSSCSSCSSTSGGSTNNNNSSSNNSHNSSASSAGANIAGNNNNNNANSSSNNNSGSNSTVSNSSSSSSSGASKPITSIEGLTNLGNTALNHVYGLGQYITPIITSHIITPILNPIAQFVNKAPSVARIPGKESHFKIALQYEDDDDEVESEGGGEEKTGGGTISSSNSSSNIRVDKEKESSSSSYSRLAARSRPNLLVVTEGGFLYRFKLPEADPAATDVAACSLLDEANLLSVITDDD